MGIALGLTAALFWGLGDFLITHLTRRVGTDRAMAYIQGLSLLSWLILLAVVRDHLTSGTALWAILLGSGVCHVLGLLLTYRAFEIGTLALVSPIASGFAIVTALLELASGERPAAHALAGAFLLIAGITLATRPPGGDQPVLSNRLAGVPEAIGSAIAFGVMFWLVGYLTPASKIGPVWTVVVLKIMASGSSFLTLYARRKAAQPAASSWGKTWLLAVGAALTDTAAWIAFIWGTRHNYTLIVTALASLFSAVTVLLAWALLRDRLSRNQWLGVAIILVGVLMVSV